MATTPARLKLSWRLGLPHTEDDEAFARLLALVEEHRRIVDEVALFESVTHHLYIPLDLYARRMELFRKRLAALREAGVGSVGINVLTTIGHTNEAWDTMPPLPFQPMVGHDGAVSRGCACPNTPELKEYVREKYRLTAKARPDFIWVDDDIRMQNHGVPWPCFCPTCLRLFSERTGREWDREALVRELWAPGGGELRAAWVEHNCASLESLLTEVSKAVAEVDPNIELGLMTAGPGWTTYSGNDFRRWFGALGAIKGRPGGGFYCDEPRMAIVGKAVDVGRQRASYPAQVTDCQYELENFPYQLLRKSAASVVNECTLALAMGLNGVALNWLQMWATSQADVLPLMAGVEAARPRLERLVSVTDGLPTVGLWTAWSWQLTARRRVKPGEDWLGGGKQYDINAPLALAAIGLPPAVDTPACGTVLAGRVAEVFSDEELMGMLSGGVLVDGRALAVLEERGLARYAGVRIARALDNGAMECFTDDPLNGSWAGEVRDARIEFWGDATGEAHVLEPTASGVRVLAQLEDYFRRPQGPCLTAYENELGGRVVVLGYAPWMFIQSVAKREQLLNAADWVTRGTLPVRILEAVPVVPTVRLSPDRRRGAIVLLNAGLEPLPEVTVLVRAPRVPVVLSTDGGERPLPQRAEQDGWSVTLPRLEAWSTVCLFVG